MLDIERCWIAHLKVIDSTDIEILRSTSLYDFEIADEMMLYGNDDAFFNELEMAVADGIVKLRGIVGPISAQVPW